MGGEVEESLCLKPGDIVLFKETVKARDRRKRPDGQHYILFRSVPWMVQSYWPKEDMVFLTGLRQLSAMAILHVPVRMLRKE